MNNVVLVGRLTKDPETRYIQGSGTAVARFTIAVDRDYKNNDGTVTTDFIPIEAMGKLAETCEKWLRKGKRIGVQGSVRVDLYKDNEGKNKTFTKVSMKSMEFLDSKQQNENISDAGFAAIDDDEDVPF